MSLDMIFSGHLLQICYMWERVQDNSKTVSPTSLPRTFCYLTAFQQTTFNPFPHTTILQQTTLNIFCEKIENLYN